MSLNKTQEVYLYTYLINAQIQHPIHIKKHGIQMYKNKPTIQTTATGNNEMLQKHKYISIQTIEVPAEFTITALT